MKTYFITFVFILFLLSSCGTPKIVSTKQLNTLNNDAVNWSLEDCRKIIDFYTVDNTGGELFKVGLTNQKVFIRITPLNTTTIKALSRKEVIEKRLNDEEYYEILDNYLGLFMNYKYDKTSGKIITADSSYSKGYAFKIFFENISNPFEPIFLEEGYSYFFLENLSGDFSRVTEVSGLYVEDYFQLDGYLNAIITFSPFSSKGKRMFNSNDLNESYRLVFNGLQKEPVIIEWQIHK